MANAQKLQYPFFEVSIGLAVPDFGVGLNKDSKRKYPSFRDKYELLSFNEDVDEEEGLYVDVQRISDKKKFTLTLADLKAVEKSSKNAPLFDDYAVWHTNFR